MRIYAIQTKAIRAMMGLALVALLAVGCSTTSGYAPGDSSPGGYSRNTVPEGVAAEMESRWGVRPVAMRLTAAGHFIDFRVEVTDPQKAKAVLDRTHKAYLVDAESGKAMPVPMTKLGPLRGSDVMPKMGRHYVILFQNVQGLIHPGSRVSVVIGDFKAEDMTVI
jgi:hypothetical protein